MDVSIVIPNYEGREVLPRTLGNLREVLASCDLEVEVIVVDDGSRDESVEYVRTEHPWVELVALERNGGFSGAVNAGAARASASHIYFMNSDVLPHEGFLEPLVAAFEADSELFAAMSLNRNPAGEVIPPGQVTPRMSRGQIRVKGLDLARLWEQGKLEQCEAIPTLFPSGGSALMAADRFRDLEGFAEIFRPYYYEDTDLGWRAWRRGWKSVMVPASVVTHNHDFSSIKSTQDQEAVRAHKKRNRFLLVWRNYVHPSDFFWKHLIWLPLYLAGRGLARDRATWNGFWAARRASSELREHRRRERAAAHLSDRQIFDRLAAARQELRNLEKSRVST